MTINGNNISNIRFANDIVKIVSTATNLPKVMIRKKALKIVTARNILESSFSLENKMEKEIKSKTIPDWKIF